MTHVEKKADERSELTAPPPDPPPGKRTCNRHNDCDAANERARAAGRFAADHCHDDCCEECFGN